MKSGDLFWFVVTSVEVMFLRSGKGLTRIKCTYFYIFSVWLKIVVKSLLSITLQNYQYCSSLVLNFTYICTSLHLVFKIWIENGGCQLNKWCLNAHEFKFYIWKKISVQIFPCSTTSFIMTNVLHENV